MRKLASELCPVKSEDGVRKNLFRSLGVDHMPLFISLFLSFAAGACSPLPLLHRHVLRTNLPPRPRPPCFPYVFHRRSVASAVLPRVTLASVLSPRPLAPKEAQGSTGNGKTGRWSGADSDFESKSVLSRLLSRCTVKEPTYDEVTMQAEGG